MSQGYQQSPHHKRILMELERMAAWIDPCNRKRTSGREMMIRPFIPGGKATRETWTVGHLPRRIDRFWQHTILSSDPRCSCLSSVTSHSSAILRPNGFSRHQSQIWRSVGTQRRHLRLSIRSVLSTATIAKLQSIRHCYIVLVSLFHIVVKTKTILSAQNHGSCRAPIFLLRAVPHLCPFWHFSG